MITDLTWKRWKTGLYCSTNKHAYLSFSSWFGPAALRLETVFYVCSVCIHLFFFFFERPGKHNSKLHTI